jgi:hypothetical protein
VSAKVAIAILAAIALATLNVFSIIAAFIYSSFYGDLFQISFLTAWLVITAFAIFMRRPLLIYVAQTVVSALIIWRITQYWLKGYYLELGNNPLSLVYGIIIIVIGYALSWCIARAIAAKNA